VILRGGSDAYRSNRILAEVITGAALEAGLPGDAIQFMADKDRKALIELLQMRDLVDLVIPRGGEALKDFLVEHSKVPVIYAAGGNCHVYVDETAIRSRRSRSPSTPNASGQESAMRLRLFGAQAWLRSSTAVTKGYARVTYVDALA
jgi:hypothetical protein